LICRSIRKVFDIFVHLTLARAERGRQQENYVMNTLKIALAAVALAASSGAAFAENQPAASATFDRVQARMVDTSRSADMRRGASEPTIFGHDAASSRYVVTGQMLNVWGHKITR
jgi:hypothetical protein